MADVSDLVLIATIALSIIFVVFSHSLYVAYKRWLTEQYLFERRRAACEQLKIAGGAVSSSGAVSNADIDRFAQTMLSTRFVFDKELEPLVGGIYDALLKKHALDALLEKAAGKAKSPADVALIEKALRKSQELSGQIANGIHRDLPEHVEKLRQSKAIRGL